MPFALFVPPAEFPEICQAAVLGLRFLQTEAGRSPCLFPTAPLGLLVLGILPPLSSKNIVFFHENGADKLRLPLYRQRLSSEFTAIDISNFIVFIIADFTIFFKGF